MKIFSSESTANLFLMNLPKAAVKTFNWTLPRGALALIGMCWATNCAAGDSGCTSPHSFLYRSCSASRNWCGFSPYVPVTPPTKYRLQTMEDTAGGATWTDSLASNGSDFGSSYLSCTGKITFSASGSTTNWSVTTVYHNPFQHTAGTISYGSPYDLVVYLNSGAFAIEQAWQSQPGTSGAISYEPTPPGSETKTYNQTNCTISTTTIYPLVSASALVGQSISATTSNMVSGAFWTPATRTYTLSEEIKRETVEQEIISVDLASCPTGNWINTPASATSTFSGNSVSVTKVGYQITLPQTQPGITYLLTWKILVYDSSGNYSGEELATATLTGTGGEVSTGELILLPPLNVGGSKTVEENSLKIEAVSADGGGGGCCGGGNSAPGQGAPKLGSIAVDFGLGKGRFGLGGGQLYLHQESLVYSSSTPASLNFVGDTNLFEILSASGSIRQVLGAQALADVLTLNPYAYEIRFYSITNVGRKPVDFTRCPTAPTPSGLSLILMALLPPTDCR